MISRTLLVVCLLFIIAGCASPVKQIKDSSIPFQRPYYSVLPPQGDNWYYARGENAGSFNLTFGKQSSSGTHTIAGLISELHSSVDFDNPNEFLNFVIKMRDMDMDPRRYNIIDYSISLDSKFGQYCIKYYYIIEDYKAANRRYEDKLA